MRTSPARTSDRGGPPAGFTLVELMIVLGLLVVLMFLAVPTFQNLLQSSLQQEVNRFTGVIRLLRNEAVLTNTRYRLMVDLKESGYFVERQDDLGGYDKVQDPRELSPHQLPAGIELRDLVLLGHLYRTDEPEPLPVVVDASGYIDPLLLHFTYDDAEYTLRVTGFTGRVELLEGYVEELEPKEDRRR